jgi:nucleoside-diphosphate-sugar epimerase
MHVFVAGATGALGRRLLPQLRSAGHSVVGLTRHPAKRDQLAAAGATPVVGDVFDADALAAAFQQHRPDAAICALTDLPQHLDFRKVEDTYAANNRVREEGTRHVVAAAAAIGLRRVVIESLAIWYAPNGPEARSEDAPLYLDAPEPVGEAVRALKRMEDHALASGLDAILLRYGAFYGPGTWYAKDGYIWQQAHKRRYPVIGGGPGVYSFIHVDDAAAATIAALERGARGIYNVVDDHPKAAHEWIPAYADAIGAPAPMHVPRMVARMVAGAMVDWEATMPPVSNARIKDELGWTPSLPTAPPDLAATAP